MSFSKGPAIWPWVIMVGLGQEALAALIITMIMETRAIGTKYSSAALGLGTMIALLGVNIGPLVSNAWRKSTPVMPSFSGQVPLLWV